MKQKAKVQVRTRVRALQTEVGGETDLAEAGAWLETVDL